MDHNDIRHRLSEYIDGSVTDEERETIEEHLKTCMQCSSALEELRKTIEQIKTVEEIEPPAWMTQKIMATVRAETEEKKGFFQRFFLPLGIKLPIQTIAVLFLAVTGFYIYQNIHPTTIPSEAPIQKFVASKQAPHADTAQGKLAKEYRPAIRPAEVPQKPTYKALDMKQEYETAPAPVLGERSTTPAPVPARSAEPSIRGKDEVTADQNAAALHDAAPSLPQEQTAPAKGLAQDEGKREPVRLQRKSRSMAADGGAGSESAPSETTITVSVRDIDDAVKNIETTIKEFDGTIISTQPSGAKRIYILSLSSSHANDLVEKLKQMGAIKEKDLALEPRESRMVFRIELKMKRSAAAAGC